MRCLALIIDISNKLSSHKGKYSDKRFSVFWRNSLFVENNQNEEIIESGTFATNWDKKDIWPGW